LSGLLAQPFEALVGQTVGVDRTDAAELVQQDATELGPLLSRDLV